MEIKKSLQLNKETAKKIYTSDDIVFFDFTMSTTKCFAVYIDNIIDKASLSQFVITPLETLNKITSIEKIAEKIFLPSVKIANTFDECTQMLTEGYAIIFIGKNEKALCVDIKKYESRSLTEPPTSAILKGPREGFIENLKTNLSLLRKRIKSNDFCVENLQVGKYTKTTVSVVYISSLANKELIEKVKKRIQAIDIDGIPDSSYISKFISDDGKSLFKHTGTTEKPDIMVAKMLEGRIGILVDGSPIAITLPYLIIEDFQTPEDYYISVFRANFIRILRVLSLFIAVLLPAFFVAAQLFHLQFIPLNFLLTIVNSIKGIPLSPSYEMFFTLLIFEILNEASIRMPKYVGMAVSIVGALVLGETAVNAGIVSTPAIMIMALSGICIYTVPEQLETVSIIRIIFLIIAGSIGAYGILLCTAFLFIYVSSQTLSFAPLLAPYAPLVKEDLKDGLTLTPVSEMQYRPKSFTRGNNDRRLKIKENDNESRQTEK